MHIDLISMRSCAYCKGSWPHHLQVIPTVGVSGENGERHRLAMLEAFRNLVDQNASKRRFLSTFRQPSSGSAERGGLDAGAVAVEEGQEADGEDTVEIMDAEGAQSAETGEGPKPEAEVAGNEPERGSGGGDNATEEAGPPEGPCSQEVAQLVAVLGGEVDAAAAGALLQRAGGDVEKALNLHLDPLPNVIVRPSKKKAAMPKGQGGVPKRKKGGALQPGSAKKTKPNNASQRSITAFFGGKASQPMGRTTAKAEPAEEPIDLDPDMDADTEPLEDKPLPESFADVYSSDAVSALHSDQAEEAVKAEPGVEEGKEDGSTQEALRTPKKLVLPPAPALAKKRKPAPAMPKATPPKSEAAVMGQQSEPKSAGVGAEPVVESQVRPATAQAAEPNLFAHIPADAVLRDVRQYDAEGMAGWQAGQPVPYAHVARALEAMDSTSKRLRISDALANMFCSVWALSPGAQLLVPCGPAGPL